MLTFIHCACIFGLFSLLLGVNNKIVVLVQCVHKMSTKTVKNSKIAKVFSSNKFCMDWSIVKIYFALTFRELLHILSSFAWKQLVWVNILWICENSSGTCFHITKALPTLNSNVNKIVLNQKKFFQMNFGLKKNSD